MCNKERERVTKKKKKKKKKKEVSNWSRNRERIS